MTQTRTENKYGKKCWHVKGDCVGRPLPDMRHFTQPLADFRSWHHFKAPPRICNIGVKSNLDSKKGQCVEQSWEWSANSPHFAQLSLDDSKCTFLSFLTECPFLLGYTNRRRKRSHVTKQRKSSDKGQSMPTVCSYKGLTIKASAVPFL